MALQHKGSLALSLSSALASSGFSHSWTSLRVMPPMQVFVPREDLSLDVIKQYQVVSMLLTSDPATAQQESFPRCVLIQPAAVLACMEAR